MSILHTATSRISACLVAATLSLTSASALAQTKNGFDLSDALIPAEDVHWGGVRRDGIPAIDKPNFIAAKDADFLGDKDRVLGVFRNGIARAYPIRILDRHEIVNDRFGDEAIVITYCPLCFSGMAFSAPAHGANDATLSFGVSGLLYNSDVLLYDRETASLWSQIRSQAVSGPLQGRNLSPIVVAHTTWREWRNRHPESAVLSTANGFRNNYRSSPYKAYQRSRQLMFPVQNRNKRYANKDLVLGIKLDGVDKAYPFKELRKNDQHSFTDNINGRLLTIEWFEKENYARVSDAKGEELLTVIVYWFAWYAFHPETEIFQAGSG